MALVAGFAIGLQVFAVYGFGQYAGAGSFTNAPWATKQKGMSQRVLLYCIF